MRHNKQDYFLTIWELIEAFGYASEKTVSKRMGISLPSVWEEIHKLERERLIRLGRHGIEFTSFGLDAAKRVVRAHRITEYFVYAYLEVPWDEVHRSVMDLEHDFTDNLLENLYRKMGSPKFCPHGNPIAPETKLYEITASESADGRYYFLRTAFEDYDFLRKLLNGGALPGAVVKLEREESGVHLVGENGETFIPKDYERSVRLADRPTRTIGYVNPGRGLEERGNF
ncbi:MAG: metal-dependent transcriptional regulator [Thermoplasmatales archaeon]